MSAATTTTTNTYCVIGAGSSGLIAARHLLAAGIACDVIEKNDDVGGNWYYGRPGSSVYKSTHLISSKGLTEIPDFPMPADYPHYPNHWQVHAYFKAYARQFKIDEHIAFGVIVREVRPHPASLSDDASPLWDVTLQYADGSTELRTYAGVVVCNGHNWDPKWPDYAGTFDGVALHSCQYKTPDVLRDQRVLVVGAGNSGCDIVVESAQHATRTLHSTRRGYYYSPKFAFGKPSDQVNEGFLKMGLPLAVQRLLVSISLKLLIGEPQQYGLPKPDHKFYETHPIVNQQILYHYGQGDITHKPDVTEFAGKTVVFKDGSREEIDVAVFATGFNIVFPFLDKSYLNWHDGRPRLFMNVFHPTYDNLFVLGLIQPDSGQWALVDAQARLLVKFLLAEKSGAAQAGMFRARKATGAAPINRGIRYVESTRHYVEVEHYSYRKQLEHLITLFA